MKNKKDDIYKALKDLGRGKIRISSRGVPHVVDNIDGHFRISIAYFARTKTWRVFWPWPSREEQERKDFKSVEECSNFLAILDQESGRYRVWKTKDGRLIKIKDMTDRHLINIIKFLEKRTQFLNSRALQYYSTCMQPSGEMAQMAFEQEAEAQISAEPSDRYSIYIFLIEEAIRRGLDYETQETN